MGDGVRVASMADLDAVVELARVQRVRLAEASPPWWSPATGADEVHRWWLEHVLSSADPVVRVVTRDGVVVGCAFAMPQPGRWFIDDVALASDDLWPSAGVELLAAVVERPAVTCVASGDAARLRAAVEAGLHQVSSYWIRPTNGGEGEPVDPAAMPADRAVAAPPLHSFPPIDPDAPGGLSFASTEGYVVGSPSISAPPVYDPGGTVAIVDRVVGDRPRLVEALVARAGERGDVLVNVIAASDDRELEQVLEDHGFTRTVEVLAWPD